MRRALAEGADDAPQNPRFGRWSTPDLAVWTTSGRGWERGRVALWGGSRRDTVQLVAWRDKRDAVPSLHVVGWVDDFRLARFAPRPAAFLSSPTIPTQNRLAGVVAALLKVEGRIGLMALLYDKLSLGGLRTRLWTRAHLPQLR
jgi:hypothetical protein